MTVERYLKAIACCLVILSVALARSHSIYWLLLTAFIDPNLLQSAFTNYCPMMTIPTKLVITDA